MVRISLKNTKRHLKTIQWISLYFNGQPTYTLEILFIFQYLNFILIDYLESNIETIVITLN